MCSVYVFAYRAATSDAPYLPRELYCLRSTSPPGLAAVSSAQSLQGSSSA